MAPCPRRCSTTCSGACSTATCARRRWRSSCAAINVDAAQAERVRSLSMVVYDALTPGAERDDDPDRLMLDGRAPGETGLPSRHAAYHKHSAYVLSNADMPGFSRMERRGLRASCSRSLGQMGKVLTRAASSRIGPPTGRRVRVAPRLAHPRSRTDARLLPARGRRRGRFSTWTCLSPGSTTIRSRRCASRPKGATGRPSA